MGEGSYQIHAGYDIRVLIGGNTPQQPYKAVITADGSVWEATGATPRIAINAAFDRIGT